MLKNSAIKKFGFLIFLLAILISCGRQKRDYVFSCENEVELSTEVAEKNCLYSFYNFRKKSQTEEVEKIINSFNDKNFIILFGTNPDWSYFTVTYFQLLKNETNVFFWNLKNNNTVYDSAKIGKIEIKKKLNDKAYFTDEPDAFGCASYCLIISKNNKIYRNYFYTSQAFQQGAYDKQIEELLDIGSMGGG